MGFLVSFFVKHIFVSVSDLMVKTGIYLFFILFWASSANGIDKLVLTTPDKNLVIQTAEKVISEAYEELGIDIMIKYLPGNRALFLSNKGEADGELVRINGIEKRYKNLLMIPIPIYIMEGLAITKVPEIKNWSPENKGLKIARVRGILWSEKITKGMNAIVFNDYDTLFKVMSFRAIDIALVARLPFIEKQKIYNIKGLRGLEPPLVEIGLYHYLNKKHSGIVPEITEVLKKMDKTGRISKIKEETISSL